MKTERLKDRFLPVNHEDSFTGRGGAGRTVDELFHLMFEEFPAPVRWLLKVRDTLVRPFGLKTGTGFADKILERTDDEIILGADDRHLDFRVSLYAGEDGIMEIRTLVRYHNLLGKLYFAAIWCFHKIMVWSIFRRALKGLNASEG